MSLYEVLKASKTERFPDYWTLLWGRKLSASMIKTITGVLPLTFTAKAGNALDWTIYGNDNVGKNQIPVTLKGQVLHGLTITVNNGEVTINGTATAVTILSIDGYTMIGADATTQYIFSGIDSGSDASYYMTITLREKSDNTFVKRIKVTNQPVTLNSEGAEFVWRWAQITVENGAVCDNVKFKPMLRAADTSPDFEPYQQGVGERTENLFDIGTSASDYVGASIGVEIDGYNLSMNVVKSGGTWTYRNKKILTTGEHTVSLSSDKTCPRVYIALRNQDDSGWLTDSDASISGFAYNSYYHGWYKDNLSYTTGNLAISVIIPICLYWQIGFGYNSIANVGTIGTLSNIMLVEGSTAPDHYTPYGYQIPLTVSQQGQTDKTVDIYIGDSPLTEDETVSKTSTGQDIELFSGENTVSTTLYNKPTMEIKYK